MTSGGEPLAAADRAFFEPRFGADFSQVRVHTDASADASARSVGALAYTRGSDVVFRRGQYDPGSSAGRQLLAHELTHVVQQGAAEASGGVVQRSASQTIQLAGDPSQVPTGLACPIANENASGELMHVRFARGSSVITPGELAALEALVVSWHGQPDSPQLRIDGFASSEGEEPDNWTLSCSRARAVVDVLTRATASGTPGIPATAIEVFAQGETDEFAATLPPNRRATIYSASPAPSPEPSPEPEPEPEGPICGPDVTSEVQSAVARTRSTFAGWSATDREAHCDALDSYSTGGYAWDIIQLHNNAWIFRDYRPACASAGATPPCGSTVEIDNECSYAGSPNYVIYGVMCRLCSDHYTASGDSDGIDRFTRDEMQSWISFYKGPGIISSGSGNFIPSTEWADAGYNGWPSVASPSGDRNTCSPACPTPFTAPAFQVAWWRNDGVLSTPTRTVI